MNKSRSGNPANFIICLLFVNLGIWRLVSGTTHRADAWAAVFFFGLCAAAALGRLLGYWPPRFERQSPRTLASRHPGDAPRVVLFYGVKIVVPRRKKKQIEAIETEKDRAAQQTGLETISGYIGKTYFCYIGRKLDTVGVHFSGHVHYSIDSLAEISADVQARLKESGTTGMPSFHMWQS
ncbi:MAG TPA: hypothetical protein VFR24_13835 [Candidatus Angelobacter sp.]|nr:hypothetical protein [Candidatus Angelobacter sp.]